MKVVSGIKLYFANIMANSGIETVVIGSITFFANSAILRFIILLRKARRTQSATMNITALMAKTVADGNPKVPTK